MLQRIKTVVKRKIQPYILKGNLFECTCCKKSYNAFLGFGNLLQKKIRGNAMCPNCYSLERHRLLSLYLQKETKIYTKECKVLHIAPEKQLFQLFTEISQIEYITGDLNPENYPKGTIKIDLLDIPFDEETFDVIICNHVLEHISEDIKAMRELHRVLKRTGWGILMVPFDKSRTTTYENFSITSPEERERHFGRVDHVRCYGLDYSDRLSKAGFHVETIDYYNSFNSYQKEHWCLGDETIHKVSKKY